MWRRKSFTFWLPALLMVAALATIGRDVLLPDAPVTSPENSEMPLGGEPVEADAPEGVIQSAAKLVLYRGMSAETPAYVVADVAVDEDFVNRVGDDWELQVHRTLEGGNTISCAGGPEY